MNSTLEERENWYHGNFSQKNKNLIFLEQSIRWEVEDFHSFFGREYPFNQWTDWVVSTQLIA